jgi:hypothetical protein
MVYRLKTENQAPPENVGFQNPAFNDILDLEHIEATSPERASLNNLMPKSSLESMQDLSLSLDELKLINNRATNALSNQEVNFVCFNHVFTVKTRTYVNFKRSLQMLKPFGVLLIMMIVLLGLFRLDILTGSQPFSSDDDDN